MRRMTRVLAFGDGERDALQQGEVDVHVEPLGLLRGEAAGVTASTVRRSSC